MSFLCLDVNTYMYLLCVRLSIKLQESLFAFSTHDERNPKTSGHWQTLAKHVCTAFKRGRRIPGRGGHGSKHGIANLSRCTRMSNHGSFNFVMAA